MKAEEFFIKEWGTGFHDATLSSDKGLLEMSMKDVYETMEKYREEAQHDLVDRYEEKIQSKVPELRKLIK